MTKRNASLTLQDLRVGSSIDVIDHLRRHGIHGVVDHITTTNGVVTVEFSDIKESTRYAWHAPAMGLVPDVSSFWTTYRRGKGPDNITFGSLYRHASRTA